MNWLLDGFDLDAAGGFLVLLFVCGGIFLVQQIEFEPGPVSDDSMPWPAPLPGESPSIWGKAGVRPAMSSVEGIHRLAEARSDLMRSARIATPQEAEAAAIAHTIALTEYLNAVTRELRK